MKTYLVATLVLLSSIAAYAEDKFGRNAPVQQLVRITEDGHLELMVLACTCKPVTKTETYTVKVPVEEDGKKVFKTEEKLRTVCEMVTESHLYAASLDLNDVKAFETNGQAVDMKTLATRLKKPTLVVIANDGKMIAPYYAAVFKPGTLIIAPQNGGDSNAPLPSAVHNDTRRSTVTGSSIKLVSQEVEKPAPAQPAPPRTEAPPADLGLGIALPKSLPPSMLFARVPETGKINLRQYSESVGEREISIEVKPRGVPETIYMKQLQKFTRSEAIQLDLSDVQATTADAKPLPAPGLTEKLKTAAVVFVSSMGQPVDSFWLKNVKPGIVVLVPPQGVAFGVPSCETPPGPPSPAAPRVVPPPVEEVPPPAPAAPQPNAKDQTG